MSQTKETYSGYVLGIDLGTTNTAVAVYKAGQSEIIPIYGAKTLPSVVSVLRNGDVLVGQQAKSRSIIDPENTVVSIKRKMGEAWTKVFDGQPGESIPPPILPPKFSQKSRQACSSMKPLNSAVFPNTQSSVFLPILTTPKRRPPGKPQNLRIWRYSVCWKNRWRPRMRMPWKKNAIRRFWSMIRRRYF